MSDNAKGQFLETAIDKRQVVDILHDLAQEYVSRYDTAPTHWCGPALYVDSKSVRRRVLQSYKMEPDKLQSGKYRYSSKVQVGIPKGEVESTQPDMTNGDELHIKDIDSDNLREAWYNPDEQILTIRFKQGAVYNYYEAEPSVWDDLWDTHQKGESVGEFFNEYIKSEYEYERLPDDVYQSQIDDAPPLDGIQVILMAPETEEEWLEEVELAWMQATAKHKVSFVSLPGEAPVEHLWDNLLKPEGIEIIETDEPEPEMHVWFGWSK